MLLQENEILLGVKDQIELLINKLDAVGSFTKMWTGSWEEKVVI